MATNPSGQETTAVEDANLPTPAVGGVIFGRDINDNEAKPLKFDGDYLLTTSGGLPSGSLLSRAVISVNTLGANSIIAAVAATSIRIYHINLVTAGAVDVTFQSAGTPLSGAYTFTANQGIALDPPGGNPVLTCASNEAFVINLSAGVAINGFCLYTQVA